MSLVRHCSLWLACLALPAGMHGHPLDVYLQATLVAIEPGGIRLEMNLTPGELVAEKVFGLIDRNHDGVISTNESAAYAELLQRELVARLDGRIIQLKLAASNIPEPAELRTGWGIIQMEYILTTGALAKGPHKFTLANQHQPVASAYLFNAARPESPLIQIKAQERNENQSAGEIAFEYHPPLNLLGVVGGVVSLAALVVVLTRLHGRPGLPRIRQRSKRITRLT